MSPMLEQQARQPSRLSVMIVGAPGRDVIDVAGS
jgi:hypothetical protein